MKPEMDVDLSQLIRCPVTKTKLAPAPASLIADLNRRIEAGSLVNRIGQVIDFKLDAGWVNQDESLLLPVREGIVILVVDQAIELGELE